MRLTINRSGIGLETQSRDPLERDNWRWMRRLAWPDNIYRAAARKVIRDLLNENRRLRNGRQPRLSLYGLALTWIDRKYPAPPVEPPIPIDRRKSA